MTRIATLDFHSLVEDFDLVEEVATREPVLITPYLDGDDLLDLPTISRDVLVFATSTTEIADRLVGFFLEQGRSTYDVATYALPIFQANLSQDLVIVKSILERGIRVIVYREYGSDEAILTLYPITKDFAEKLSSGQEVLVYRTDEDDTP